MVHLGAGGDMSRVEQETMVSDMLTKSGFIVFSEAFQCCAYTVKISSKLLHRFLYCFKYCENMVSALDYLVHRETIVSATIVSQ